MKKKSFFYGFVIIFVTCMAKPVVCQNHEGREMSHWQLLLGGSVYYVSKANNWNFGPDLTINYSISQSRGIYWSVVYPFTRMTSKGYGFREGLAFDLGFWIAPRQIHSWLHLGAGFNYIFGSDADGSLLRAFGSHISAQVLYWLKDSIFGMQLRGVMRYWFSEMHSDSRLTSSFSAGIALRF
jgi:hypothetical protein